MPFAMVEGFNRRLTFIVAWNIAIDMGHKNPYDFGPGEQCRHTKTACDRSLIDLNLLQYRDVSFRQILQAIHPEQLLELVCAGCKNRFVLIGFDA